jgi:hypothetical protein
MDYSEIKITRPELKRETDFNIMYPFNSTRPERRMKRRRTTDAVLIV